MPKFKNMQRTDPMLRKGEELLGGGGTVQIHGNNVFLGKSCQCMQPRIQCCTCTTLCLNLFFVYHCTAFLPARVVANYQRFRLVFANGK